MKKLSFKLLVSFVDLRNTILEILLIIIILSCAFIFQPNILAYLSSISVFNLPEIYNFIVLCIIVAGLSFFALTMLFDIIENTRRMYLYENREDRLIVESKILDRPMNVVKYEFWWNYKFPGDPVKDNDDYYEAGTPSNTICVWLSLEDENGETLLIQQKLPPWTDNTGDIPYNFKMQDYVNEPYSDIGFHGGYYVTNAHLLKVFKKLKTKKVKSYSKS